jgi:hypothetical protein
MTENLDKKGIIYGVFLLIGMFLASIIRNILKSQVDLNGRHWGIQLRAVLTHEIYLKSLRRAGGLSSGKDDCKRASQGKIVNLMSSGAFQF